MISPMAVFHSIEGRWDKRCSQRGIRSPQPWQRQHQLMQHFIARLDWHRCRCQGWTHDMAIDQQVHHGPGTVPRMAWARAGRVIGPLPAG